MKAIEELVLRSQLAVYDTQPKPQDLELVLCQLFCSEPNPAVNLGMTKASINDTPASSIIGFLYTKLRLNPDRGLIS